MPCDTPNRERTMKPLPTIGAPAPVQRHCHFAGDKFR